ATFLAIPCNTAHVCIGDLQKYMNMPVLDMISLTAKYIVEKFGSTAKIGLLATDGTIKAKIFHKEFMSIAPEIHILSPDTEGQQNVKEAIYGEKGIKASQIDTHNLELLYSEAKKLIDNGAHVIVAGCTEIPLVLTQEKCD